MVDQHTEVIDIPNDGNMEKSVAPNMDVGVNDDGSNQTMVHKCVDREVFAMVDQGGGENVWLVGFGRDGAGFAGSTKKQGSISLSFSPNWSLREDSCLFVFETIVNFNKNAFPQ